MNISKATRYALASTVATDLSKEDEKALLFGSSDVEFHVLAYTSPEPPIQPCPRCPDGDPGDPGEFEFYAEFFGCPVNLSLLPEWAYNELETAVYEEYLT